MLVEDIVVVAHQKTLLLRFDSTGVVQDLLVDHRALLGGANAGPQNDILDEAAREIEGLA